MGQEVIQGLACKRPRTKAREPQNIRKIFLISVLLCFLFFFLLFWCFGPSGIVNWISLLLWQDKKNIYKKSLAKVKVLEQKRNKPRLFPEKVTGSITFSTR